MKIKYVVNKSFAHTQPFESILRIEERLIQFGYLVVIDENEKYKGLVTINDVLEKQHNLVIDCISNITGVSEEEDISTALDLMYDKKINILPVFSSSNSFIGIITLTQLLEELSKYQNQSNNICINNIVGNNDLERAKQLFINQLFHNTKNPIQVILSSLDLLKETTKKKEIDILHNNIRSSIKKIDDLVDKLYSEYYQCSENMSYTIDKKT